MALEKNKKAKTLREARKMVTVTATEKNPHHKTGTPITCDEKIAAVLEKKGYASNKGAKE